MQSRRWWSEKSTNRCRSEGCTISNEWLISCAKAELGFFEDQFSFRKQERKTTDINVFIIINKKKSVVKLLMEISIRKVTAGVASLTYLAVILFIVWFYCFQNFYASLNWRGSKHWRCTVVLIRTKLTLMWLPKLFLMKVVDVESVFQKRFLSLKAL